MKIEVNLTKRYFLILLGIVLVLGILLFVQAYGTNNPSVFGHSVGEINWNDIIPGSLYVRDAVRVDGGSIFVRDGVWVGGQSALASDLSSILVGDLNGGDGIRQLILKAGDQDRVTITSGGNVGIGKIPSQKLDVAGNANIDGAITAQEGTVAVQYYYVGTDRDTQSPPDCWLMNRPIRWGGNPYTIDGSRSISDIAAWREWCAKESVSRTGINNAMLINWSLVPGLTGNDPANGNGDTTSDRLQVLILSTPSPPRQAF